MTSGSVQVQNSPSFPSRKFSPPNGGHLSNSPPKVSSPLPQKNTQNGITYQQVQHEKTESVKDIIRIMGKLFEVETQSVKDSDKLRLKLKVKKSKRFSAKKAKELTKACGYKVRGISITSLSKHNKKKLENFKLKHAREGKVVMEENFKGDIAEYARFRTHIAISRESLENRFVIGKKAREMARVKDVQQLIQRKISALAPVESQIYTYLWKRSVSMIDKIEKSAAFVRSFIRSVEGISPKGSFSQSVFLRKACLNATAALSKYGFANVPKEWWN